VETVSTRIPKQPRLVRGTSRLPGLLRRLDDPTQLGERTLGDAVTDHRTSWVRRLTIDTTTYYVKTYDYESFADAVRAWHRNTGPLCRSRAAAESDALDWMRQHDLPAPQPVGVLEHRRFGLLRRAVLITEAFAGTAADVLMQQLSGAERGKLAAAIATLVAKLHRLGFRDRNLDLRNLIARAEPPGESGESGDWLVGKIDSPRHRLRRPGRTDDALARADWARLMGQLAPFGITPAALARFTHPPTGADPRS